MVEGVTGTPPVIPGVRHGLVTKAQPIQSPSRGETTKLPGVIVAPFYEPDCHGHPGLPRNDGLLFPTMPGQGTSPMTYSASPSSTALQV